MTSFDSQESKQESSRSANGSDRIGHSSSVRQPPPERKVRAKEKEGSRRKREGGREEGRREGGRRREREGGWREGRDGWKGEEEGERE